MDRRLVLDTEHQQTGQVVDHSHDPLFLVVCLCTEGNLSSRLHAQDELHPPTGLRGETLGNHGAPGRHGHLRAVADLGIASKGIGIQVHPVVTIGLHVGEHGIATAVGANRRVAVEADAANLRNLHQAERFPHRLAEGHSPGCTTTEPLAPRLICLLSRPWL